MELRSQRFPMIVLSYANHDEERVVIDVQTKMQIM